MNNFASTSTFQSGFTQNKVQDGAFKTSNPQIFPSLNPFSNFYRQNNGNKNARPNPAFTGHNESQELVKKVKVENGVERQVSTTFFNEEKKEKITPKPADQDVFRVPKLPRRLLQNKEQASEEKKPNEYMQFESVGGHSDFSSLFASELKAIQTPVKAEKKTVVAKSQQVKILPLKIKEEKTVGFSNQEMTPSMFNALYDRLKMEYYNFQLRQSLMSMYQYKPEQLVQQNWQSGQYISQDMLNQLSRNFLIAANKAANAQGNVKQEVQC